MKNIHIPEGVSFSDYVKDSLNNAVENGDAEFLTSLENLDAQALADDMADYDAGVERHLELAGEGNDLAYAELVGIVEEWCKEQSK